MKKTTRFAVAIPIIAVSLIIYQLWWGRPFNINLFYTITTLKLLKDDPETLTLLGPLDGTPFDFYNTKLTDASPMHERSKVATYRQAAELLKGYDPSDFSGHELLSYNIFRWYLDDAVRGERFAYHNYPVNHYEGVQKELVDLMVSRHALTDSKGAEQYLARLNAFENKFNSLIDGLLYREKQGILPPRFVLDESIKQMQTFIASPPERNVLYTSFVQKLDAIEGLEDRDQLASLALKAINEAVYPAYRRLIAYCDPLARKAAEEDGVWHLPDGDAYYSYRIRHYTTLDLTPAEVHATGLQHVERIQNEMTAVLEKLGCTQGTPAECMQQFAQEQHFRYADNDEGRARALKDYQDTIDTAERVLAPQFNLKAPGAVQVVRVPAFKEQGAPAASYYPPSMNGNRPGMLFVNLGNMNTVLKYAIPTLAHHEGAPGHHYQRGLQTGMKALPTFRRAIRFTAQVEGWAMYAERLAWEAGLLNDPYANLGRLQAELWRAARLVVDTGIHYKRWTREQAISYMAEVTGMPFDQVTAEVDRYIIDPGQACAYMTGLLFMLEQREKVQTALGKSYDPKAFHDLILGAGSPPLAVLEDEVDRYIAEQSPVVTANKIP